jgi:hypothetical protein
MNQFEEMKAIVVAEEKWAHEVIGELEGEEVLEAHFEECIRSTKGELVGVR